MKIIVAGYPKTGTKSLNAALTELGYNVYDYMEHYFYHYNEWIRIYEGKEDIEVFKEMYQDVDAVVDAPACFFWYEIHQAFPDAKIILTTRDEESWFKSLKKQWTLIDSHWNSFSGIYKAKLLPVARNFLNLTSFFSQELSGMPLRFGSFYSKHAVNEMLVKQNYLKRNAFVLQEAPKDKLLVFNIKNGWEPLCKFLGKKIPNIAFPHRNAGGHEVADKTCEQMYTNRLRKEMMASFIILTLILLLLCFSLRHFTFQNQIATVLSILVGLIFIL